MPVASALLLAVPSSLRAQEGMELSGNVALVSDYRFRGISLSDRDPAVQGGIDLERGALVMGVWASSIADYGGANAEVDLYAGVTGSFASVTWTAAANAYLYPGGAGVDYLEVVAEGERAVGPVTFGLEAAWVPEQRNAPEANRYLGASAAMDITADFGLAVRGGYEDGFYDGKWDWELGATYSLGSLRAGLSYVDTNYSKPDQGGRLAGAGIVATLLAQF